MSGGHYYYAQSQILDIINQLKKDITNNKLELSKVTLDEFRKGLCYLETAYVYTQRIDYLLSHDDSEDNFHERLKADLNKIKSSL